MCTRKLTDPSDTPGNTSPVSQPTPPLFRLGMIVATPGVLEHLDRHEINAQAFIQRHQCGDWGNVPPEDAEENELSVKEGYRVLSSYDVAGERVWIITEADRSATTLLFPSEY